MNVICAGYCMQFKFLIIAKHKQKSKSTRDLRNKQIFIINIFIHMITPDILYHIYIYIKIQINLTLKDIRDNKRNKGQTTIDE